LGFGRWTRIEAGFVSHFLSGTTEQTSSTP
jgi:hypothetical protein